MREISVVDAVLVLFPVCVSPAITLSVPLSNPIFAVLTKIAPESQVVTSASNTMTPVCPHSRLIPLKINGVPVLYDTVGFAETRSLNWTPTGKLSSTIIFDLRAPER